MIGDVKELQELSGQIGDKMEERESEEKIWITNLYSRSRSPLQETLWEDEVDCVLC
jgi:hypothetical protein